MPKATATIRAGAPQAAATATKAAYMAEMLAVTEAKQ